MDEKYCGDVPLKVLGPIPAPRPAPRSAKFKIFCSALEDSDSCFTPASSGFATRAHPHPVASPAIDEVEWFFKAAYGDLGDSKIIDCIKTHCIDSEVAADCCTILQKVGQSLHRKHSLTDVSNL